MDRGIGGLCVQEITFHHTTLSIHKIASMQHKAPFTQYNLLSNRLSNVCIHDTTGCQTRCQTGCQTGMTTGCIVYTNIQPVVKPFDNRFDKRLYRVYSQLSNRLYNPVWQPVVLCKRGLKVHN